MRAERQLIERGSGQAEMFLRYVRQDGHLGSPKHLRTYLLRLLEATPCPVMVSTSGGRLLYMNAMGRSMLGVTPHASLDSRTVADFYPRCAYERFLEEAMPTCLRLGFWRGETTLIDCNQQQIPVSQVLLAHQIEDQAGESLTVLSSIAWDIREHKRTEQALRHQATHDALTGLPNRALMIDRLSQAIRSAQRHGTFVGVLFLDVDNFKSINDDIGHEPASELLRELGRRLHAQVRAEDTVARYGGDEFVLLVPNLRAPGDIACITKQIEKALVNPFVLGGRRLSVAGSVGAAIYPDDGEDAETLLHKADSMMYRKKRHARNDTVRAASAAPPLRSVVVN